jgi:hypothetical protein
MSNWQEYDIRKKIEVILADVQYSKPEHHFRRPFLSAYQLAIEFVSRYPEDARRLDLQIGGEGIGERVSLAHYLAGQLSERIHSGEITNIEGSFLSNLHLIDITLDNNGESIKSSLTKTPFDLSMFRLKA